jgi:hypothetical protein
MDNRPDQLDKMVYTETWRVRNMYYEICRKLGLIPKTLTPVTLMQRSIATEQEDSNVEWFAEWDGADVD